MAGRITSRGFVLEPRVSSAVLDKTAHFSSPALPLAGGPELPAPPSFFACTAVLIGVSYIFPTLIVAYCGSDIRHRRR
jgi:hypothetical protein